MDNKTPQDEQILDQQTPEEASNTPEKAPKEKKKRLLCLINGMQS